MFWPSLDVARSFLLVCVLHGDFAFSAEEMYTQVTAMFGSASCYLLTLVSAEVGQSFESEMLNGDATTAAAAAAQQSDPWLSHVLPQGYQLPLSSLLEGEGREVDEFSKPINSSQRPIPTKEHPNHLSRMCGCALLTISFSFFV